jgi:hypothetical protein
MRSLGALLSVLFLLTAAPRAQCIHLSGGCSGGALLSCETPPRIGTTWLIRATVACAPSPRPNAMVFGGCGTPVPVGGLACFSCTGCALWLSPVQVLIGWPGIFSLGVPIPNNTALVGGRFCVQNACLNTTGTCLCLSNAVQVTVTR